LPSRSGRPRASTTPGPRRLESATTLPAPAGDLGAALACYPRTRLLFAPLLDELAVTFKFFRESLRRPLPKLHLSGGLANLPGIDGFFGGVFGIPAERLAVRAGGIDFPPERAPLADALLRKEAKAGA
jgi:hypothetical protein